MPIKKIALSAQHPLSKMTLWPCPAMPCCIFSHLPQKGLRGEKTSKKHTHIKCAQRRLECIIAKGIGESHGQHSTATLLIHQWFLLWHHGTHGPTFCASEGSFPLPNTPIKGLLLCENSCLPGIGVLAAARL